MANVDVIVGLGFGDEGKGSTVDALTRRHGAKLVVRFNGGAQAGHNVVEDSGRHHCFSQWGSGTFAGARTLLSRFMMVNPLTALREAEVLKEKGVTDPLSLLYVETGAPITTPFHMAANRCKEALRRLGGSLVHGSCGMGIGETMADLLANEPDNISASELVSYKPHLRQKLRSIQDRKLAEIVRLDPNGRLRDSDWGAVDFGALLSTELVEETVTRFFEFASGIHLAGHDWISTELEEPGHVLFEGAQGVLLDQDHGFQPHTTWSDCTFGNANWLLAGHRGPVRRLGVLRAFHTRHGEGPLPTERSDFLPRVADDHNAHGKWQGHFRAGAFDLVLAKYALLVAPDCDALVFTHLDKVRPGEDIAVCTRYDTCPVNQSESLAELPQRIAGSSPRYTSLAIQPGHPHDGARQYARTLAGWLDRPIASIAYGPKASDRQEW